MIALLVGLFMGFPSPPATFQERWPPVEWRLHSPLEFHPLPQGWHQDPPQPSRYGNNCISISGVVRCTREKANV